MLLVLSRVEVRRIRDIVLSTSEFCRFPRRDLRRLDNDSEVDLVVNDDRAEHIDAQEFTESRLENSANEDRPAAGSKRVEALEVHAGSGVAKRF